jgi:uncharacterized protein
LTVRVYLDGSALLKRVVAERDSVALLRTLRRYVDVEAALVSSSLAWIEVSRALKRASRVAPAPRPDRLTDLALSGVLEKPIGPEVVALARRVGPPVMRNLDAIHLATALLIDADVVVSYDDRLLAAAAHQALDTISPTGVVS